MRVFYFFLFLALLHSSQSQLLRWPFRTSASSSGSATTSGAASATGSTSGSGSITGSASGSTGNAVGLIRNVAGAASSVVDAVTGTKQAGLNVAGLASTGAAAATSAGIRAGTLGTRLAIGAAQTAANAPLAATAAAGHAMINGAGLGNSAVNLLSSMGQGAVGTAGSMALSAVTGGDAAMQMALRFMSTLIQWAATLQKTYIDIASGMAVAGAQIPRMIGGMVGSMASITSGPFASIFQNMAPRFIATLTNIMRSIQQGNYPQAISSIRDAFFGDASIISDISGAVRSMTSQFGSNINIAMETFKDAIHQTIENMKQIKQQIKDNIQAGMNQAAQLIKEHKGAVLGIIDDAIQNANSLSTPEEVNALMEGIQNRVNTGIEQIQERLGETLDSAASLADSSIRDQIARLQTVGNSLKEQVSQISDSRVSGMARWFIDEATQRSEEFLRAVNEKIQAVRPMIRSAMQVFEAHEKSLVDNLLSEITTRMIDAINNGSMENTIQAMQDLRSRLDAIMDGRADLQEMIMSPLRNIVKGFEDSVRNFLNSITSMMLNNVNLDVNVRAEIRT